MTISYTYLDGIISNIIINRKNYSRSICTCIYMCMYMYVCLYCILLRDYISLLLLLLLWEPSKQINELTTNYTIKTAKCSNYIMSLDRKWIHTTEPKIYMWNTYANEYKLCKQYETHTKAVTGLIIIIYMNAK